MENEHTPKGEAAQEKANSVGIILTVALGVGLVVVFLVLLGSGAFSGSNAATPSNAVGPVR